MSWGKQKVRGNMTIQPALKEIKWWGFFSTRVSRGEKIDSRFQKQRINLSGRTHC